MTLGEVAHNVKCPANIDGRQSHDIWGIDG